MDRNNNLYGNRPVETDIGLFAHERHAMKDEPYFLDGAGRTVVLDAIKAVCVHRRWTLLAAHVRSSHVYAIVDAEPRPEQIMNTFKAYASRSLNQLMSEKPDRKGWARHGSTRLLWKDKDVQDAMQNVVECQGEPMALFVSGLL